MIPNDPITGLDLGGTDSLFDRQSLKDLSDYSARELISLSARNGYDSVKHVWAITHYEFQRVEYYWNDIVIGHTVNILPLNRSLSLGGVPSPVPMFRVDCALEGMIVCASPFAPHVFHGLFYDDPVATQYLDWDIEDGVMVDGPINTAALAIIHRPWSISVDYYESHAIRLMFRTEADAMAYRLAQ